MKMRIVAVMLHLDIIVNDSEFFYRLIVIDIVFGLNVRAHLHRHHLAIFVAGNLLSELHRLLFRVVHKR